MLRDQWGRVMRSLRVSVTARCNLRCRYCVPAGACPDKSLGEQLSNTELVRLCRILVEEGIERIKLTGGEPLLRPGLSDLVRELNGLPQLKELSLTTNGTLLAAQAEALAKAGLKRVTVSLDSLDPTVYQQLTRGGNLDETIKGLEAAEKAGLKPIKLNAVVLRGWNLEELVDLAVVAIAKGWDLRFIEFMPLIKDLGLSPSEGVPSAELRARLEHHLGPLRPLRKSDGAGPAELWSLNDGRGKLGFISAMSERFCAECDRLRLGSRGFLRLCMGHENGVDLGEALRQGAKDSELAELIRGSVWLKPAGHSMHETSATASSMVLIGG